MPHMSLHVLYGKNALGILINHQGTKRTKK